MQFGAAIFFTDYSMARGRARPGAGGARLRVALGAGALAHPALAQVALSSRRRSAEAVLRRDGPVRDAERRGGRHKTLKLGTGVCLVIQRDTIQTAKPVASLDQVSGGRFLFGIGGGWNPDEMEDHGTVYETRFKKMREQIEAMQRDLDQDRSPNITARSSTFRR